MAGPIRFRRATDTWTRERVEAALLEPLDSKFGARLTDPRFEPPPAYAATRFVIDNGDLALFAWRTDGPGAFWLGNTETPKPLWRTEKETFTEAPYPIARWAQRILLAELAETDPWLAEYKHLSWFFLPVFFSKDGRETTRQFFRDHAAGFPDATREDGLAFYESVLSTGVLDDHRYTMATKLGTSPQLDLVRMRAAMAELNAVKLFVDGGYSFVPEVQLDSGYALDFRVEASGTLVEVTRPEPPGRRRAGTGAGALRDTVDGKTKTQLDVHEGAVLFVDCTSFRDDEWEGVLAERPPVGYRPALVYRCRPDGSVTGYTHGSIPISFPTLQTPQETS